MRRPLAVLAAVLLFAEAGRAAQPVPPGALPDEPDLLPAAKPRSAEEDERARALADSLRTRRTLLQVHQAVGLALLADMTAAVVLGQLDYRDKYGGGGDTGRFRTAHRVAAYSTAGLFETTALLALFAPAPFDRPTKVDTATLHKVAMATAAAGMVAQLALGLASAHSEGTLRQRDFALAHQIVGYTTLAATSTGFLVLWF